MGRKKKSDGAADQEMQKLASSSGCDDEEGEEIGEEEEDEEEASEQLTDSIESITRYTLDRLQTHERAQLSFFLSLLAAAIAFCFLVPWRLLADAHDITQHHQAEDEIALRLFRIADANRSIQQAQFQFLHYVWSQDAADAQAVSDAIQRSREILGNVSQVGDNVRPDPTLKALCNQTIGHMNVWHDYLQKLMVENEQTRSDEALYEKFQMEYRELRVTAFYNEILEKLFAEMTRIQTDYGQRYGHLWRTQEHPYVHLIQLITKHIALDMDFDSEILAFGHWQKIETRVENEATVAHEIQDLIHLEETNPDHGTVLTIEELQRWYDRFLDQQFIKTLHLVFTDRKDGSEFLKTFGGFLRMMANETGIFIGDWDSGLMRAIRSINEMNKTEEARLEVLYASNPQDVDDVVKQAILWAFVVAAGFTLLIFLLYNPFWPCIYTDLRIGGCNFVLCLVVSLGIFAGVCGIAGTAAQQAIDREAGHEAATRHAMLEVASLDAAVGEWQTALSLLEEGLITGSAGAPLQFHDALRELAQRFTRLRDVAHDHAYMTRSVSQVDSVLNSTLSLRSSLEHWGGYLLRHRHEINTAIIEIDELTRRLGEAHIEQVEVESHLDELHNQIDYLINMGGFDDIATHHVMSELTTFENLYLKATGNGLAYLEDTVGGENNPTYVHYIAYRDKCYKQGRYLEATMEEWIHGPPVPNRLVGECSPGRLCEIDVRAMEGAIEHVIGEFDHFWHEIDKLIIFKHSQQSEDVFTAKDMRKFYLHHHAHIESINADLMHLLDKWRLDVQVRVREEMPRVLDKTTKYRNQVVWSSIIGLWTMCLYWHAVLHVFFSGFSAAALPRPQVS